MGYGKEIYDKANEKLDLRRHKAVMELNKRRERIYNELPEVRDMEAELVHIGTSAAKAVFAGGDVKTELEKMREKSLQTQALLRETLSKKGYSPDDLEEKYTCPDCRDKGYIDGRMCRCMKRLLRDIAYKEINSRSPLPLERSSFESFDIRYYSNQPRGEVVPRTQMEFVLKRCKNYAESFGKDSPSILMEGGTGLGKTHLSLAIASRVIDKGFGVIYGSTPDLLAVLEKEKFSYNSDSDKLDRLQGCDLLIMDDLGTEFSNSFSRAAVYNLINTRMGHGKPTIVNTNLSLKELKANYSDRLVSRFVGENIYLSFIGEDIRIKKAALQRTRN